MRAEEVRDLIYCEGAGGGGLASRFSYGSPISFEAARRRKAETMRFRCFCGTFDLTTPFLTSHGRCLCAECCRSTGGLEWTTIEGEKELFELPENLDSYGSRRYCRKCGALVAFIVKNGLIALSLIHLTDYTLFDPKPGSRSDYIFTDDQRGLKLAATDGAEDGLLGLLKPDGLKRRPRYYE